MGESSRMADLEALRVAAANMDAPPLSSSSSSLSVPITISKENPVVAATATNTVSVSQVAELAAAAAHRKSLNEEELLSGASGQPRRMISRHRSSGASLSRHRSGGASGPRAMSRGLTQNQDVRGNPLAAGSTGGVVGSPRRGVHRSISSDVSPMLSASFSRTALLRTDDNGDVAPQRGVRRVKSMAAPTGEDGGGGDARRGPDRRGGFNSSDSARGEPRRRGVGRTCSQTSLAHMSQNGAASAEVGTLRPYRGREGTGTLHRSDSSGIGEKQQQLSLLRRSVDDRSVGELSNFTMATMDSVNLRKQQIVADPIDDSRSYDVGADSVADHESAYTMNTNDDFGYTEFLPEVNPNHVPYDGVSVTDTLASDVESTNENAPGSACGYRRSSREEPRLLADTRILAQLEDASDHSRPDQIACDAVSLSTMGGEMDEIDSSSYLGDDYANTLREEIEAFEEADDEEEDYEDQQLLQVLEGVKEQQDEEESAVSSRT